MIGDLSDSPWKILIAAVVILVLSGSKKLPHAARSPGQSMRILKREVQDLHQDEPDADSPSTVAAPAELTASPQPAQQAQIDALQQQIRDLQRGAAMTPGTAPLAGHRPSRRSIPGKPAKPDVDRHATMPRPQGPRPRSAFSRRRLTLPPPHPGESAKALSGKSAQPDAYLKAGPVLSDTSARRVWSCLVHKHNPLHPCPGRRARWDNSAPSSGNPFCNSSREDACGRQTRGRSRYRKVG